LSQFCLARPVSVTFPLLHVHPFVACTWSSTRVASFFLPLRFDSSVIPCTIRFQHPFLVATDVEINVLPVPDPLKTIPPDTGCYRLHAPSVEDLLSLSKQLLPSIEPPFLGGDTQSKSVNGLRLNEASPSSPPLSVSSFHPLRVVGPALSSKQLPPDLSFFLSVLLFLRCARGR